MIDNQWKVAWEIYGRGAGTPAAEREDSADAVGDPEVAQQLRALIASEPEHSYWPSAAETPIFAMPSLQPETAFGNYKLVEVLGEGGMGVVYRAEQEQPIRRTVALKIIRPGLRSKEILTRFQLERQALALTEHPNIARVLDAGSTPDGSPYLVMEYVAGIPITKFCRERRPSLRELLEMFSLVCGAIQHAHLKGIIHRDIKPSNVLVSELDGKPFPKVIDFGVAKAIEDSGALEQTQFGCLVGTLEYMSPEQASLSDRRVDIRADVYSLGVLLYEILTGTTPLQSATAGNGGLLQRLERLQNEEVQPPSERVKGLGSPPFSSGKSGTLSRPGTELRGELDWIVLKALQRNRDDRYQTVSALARDIQRFLAGQPVEAGPASAIYRLRKLAVKRSATTAIGAALMLVLIGATTFSLHRTPLLRAGANVAHPAVNSLSLVPVTAFDGAELYPSVSSDGAVLAFSWSRNGEPLQIYIQQRGESEPHLLADSPYDLHYPVLSPDARAVVFTEQRGYSGTLYLTPTSGGRPRKLTDLRIVLSGTNVTWRRDGKALLFVDWPEERDSFRFYTLDLETGLRQPTNLPDSSMEAFPRYSPDGKQLAISYIWKAEIPLYPIRPDGLAAGSPRKVYFQQGGVRSVEWLADGKSLIINGADRAGTYSLWRMNLASSQDTMVAVPGSTHASNPSVAFGTDEIYFDVDRESTDLFVQTRNDRSWKRVCSSESEDDSVDLSADGRLLVFRTTRRGRSAVWMCSLSDERTNPWPVPFDGELTRVRLSPDQRSVAFVGDKDKKRSIFVAGDTGEARRISPENHHCDYPAWSPDGRFIYYTARETDRWQIFRLPVEGGIPTQITRGGGYSLVVSVDGQEIYFRRSWKERGVWRVSAWGEGERQLLPSKYSPQMAVYGGVYVLEDGQDGRATIHFLKQPSGQLEFVTSVGGELLRTDGLPVTVTPDRRITVIARKSPRQGDIFSLRP